MMLTITVYWHSMQGRQNKTHPPGQTIKVRTPIGRVRTLRVGAYRWRSQFTSIGDVAEPVRMPLTEVHRPGPSGRSGRGVW